MKKFFIGLLAAFSLVLLSVPAFAAETPALTVSSAWENAVVTVSVGIEHNPGIAGFDVCLSYDAAELRDPMVAVSDSWQNTADCSTDTAIKVACVREGDLEEDGVLFSVTFAAPYPPTVNFTAEGTACSWDEREVSLVPASCSETANVLAVSGNVTGLRRTASNVTGSVTAAVSSFGDNYHGDAILILSCYQDGRFCGCKSKAIAVEENSVTSVALTDVSFPLSDTAEPTVRLLLLTPQYAPLTKSVTLPAVKNPTHAGGGTIA